MTIDIPDSLPYPRIDDVLNVPELSDRFVYVLKAYPMNGYSVVISRNDGYIGMKFADWSGKTLTQEDIQKNEVIQRIMKYNVECEKFMVFAAIKQLQFYYTIDGILVDVRASLNKLCGPGYIYDFFGKMKIPTQEKVGDPTFFKKDLIDKFTQKIPPYTDDAYIIKTSAFKSIVRNDDVLPLYGILKRETQQPS